LKKEVEKERARQRRKSVGNWEKELGEREEREKCEIDAASSPPVAWLPK